MPPPCYQSGPVVVILQTGVVTPLHFYTVPKAVWKILSIEIFPAIMGIAMVLFYKISIQQHRMKKYLYLWENVPPMIST
jgi:hypothetical protein